MSNSEKLRSRAASVVALISLIQIAGLSSTQAQGLLDFLFGGRTPVAVETPDDSAAILPRARITITPRRTTSVASAHSNLVCVRTCDGYHFPLSSNVAKSDADTVCKLGCPAAETKVFQRRGDDINNAVAADRSAYSKLASANTFRSSYSAACGCFSSQIKSEPVFDDPTMKPGDVVIINARAMTLRVGAVRPYDETDYEYVERSARISATVKNMVRAKLGNATVVGGSQLDESPRAVSSGIQSEIRVVVPSPYEYSPEPRTLSETAVMSDGSP